MNPFSSVTGELLNRMAEMSDQEKMEFLIFLNKWSHEKAQALGQKMNPNWLEIVE